MSDTLPKGLTCQKMIEFIEKKLNELGSENEVRNREMARLSYHLTRLREQQKIHAQLKEEHCSAAKQRNFD